MDARPALGEGTTPSEPGRSRKVAGILRKLVVWLALAAALYFLIASPDVSGRWVSRAGHALGGIATSLGHYVRSLA